MNKSFYLLNNKDSTILVLEKYNAKLQDNLADAKDVRLVFYSKLKEYEDKVTELSNK